LLSQTDRSSIRQSIRTASYSSSSDDEEILPTAAGLPANRSNGNINGGAGSGGGGGCGSGNGTCCSGGAPVTTPSTTSTVVVDIEDLLNRTRQRANGANNKDVDKIESAPAADEYVLVITNTISSVYSEKISLFLQNSPSNVQQLLQLRT